MGSMTKALDNCAAMRKNKNLMLLLVLGICALFLFIPQFPVAPRLDQFCPSVENLLVNVTTKSAFRKSYNLPNGYDIGELLNVASFKNSSRAPDGSVETKETATAISKEFPKSVMGLYYIDYSHESKRRIPSVRRLRRAVHHFGISYMHEGMKRFCDEVLSDSKTLLVHIGTSDLAMITESYISTITKIAGSFNAIVLTGGCPASSSHAHHGTAIEMFLKSIRLLHGRLRYRDSCKLRVLPNFNPDDTFYAFYVASNILVDSGDFAVLGGLITNGNLYLGQGMAEYYEDHDFKNHKKVMTLFPSRNDEYTKIYDTMDEVVSTSCIMDTFGKGDDSKRICLTPSLQNNCWMMSIGSNGMFGFETDVFLKTKCEVHIFDCTGDWQVPSSISSRVFIHKKCIGNSPDNVNFLPYADLVSIATRGKNTKPVYVKMDIEGYEYDVLPAMLSAPENIIPDQVSFELHVETYMKASEHFEPIEKSQFSIDKSHVYHLFYQLHVVGGYRLISRVPNPYCDHCCEVVMMKEKALPEM